MGLRRGYTTAAAAYNATSGAELWRVQTDAGVEAPPMTYSVAGKQYVSVYAGGLTTLGPGGATNLTHGTASTSSRSAKRIDAEDTKTGERPRGRSPVFTSPLLVAATIYSVRLSSFRYKKGFNRCVVSLSRF